jgi:low affinity Fe/Cu permease
MLGVLDLIGLALVCATVLGVFLLRGSFRTEIDELEEAQDQLIQRDEERSAEIVALTKRLKDVTETVTENAVTLGKHDRALTGNAALHIGGRNKVPG